MSEKAPTTTVCEPCGLTFRQLRRLSDEEVMAHLQAGHDDALTVLFDRYHRLVLAVALKILRDAGEAEDLMQSVFLEICKVAGQFDGSRGTTKVWLLQYAYHRSLNRRRYLVRRKFYEPSEEALDESLPPQRSVSMSSAGVLALPEVRALIRQGLESLNHLQKRTLQMAYFEGMSLQEIADQTGESLGNVRHHYYRGLRRMRALLLNGQRSEAPKEKTDVVRRGVVDAKA